MRSMRRLILLQLVENRRPFQLRARGGMDIINGIPPRCSVLLIDELRYRDFCKVRIAHELRAIEERPPERLCGEMNRRRRPVAELGQIVPLENIQRLQQNRSARRGRWRTDDLVSAIRATNRFALFY